MGVRRIVIVGGGSAGWLTAGTIAAAHKTEQEDGITVTLIESPNVPTIGVGEGTWPTMRNTLRKMGVSETSFIRDCDAAFKQGARFSGWATGAADDAYYHPLVLPQGFLEGNLAPHWLRDKNGKSFSAAVCPQDSVCDHNLAPKQITTPEYAGVLNYAYHLNAGKLGGFLRDHCIASLGVRHILDDVTSINPADNGDIASVSTAHNGDILGDLFIDCSGLRSLLLGEHYGVPFMSCRDRLFIDRALAVQVPYDSEDAPIASQTNSTAQSAGWIWDIGLQTRKGVGHVYSSAHTDEDVATRELDQYLAGMGRSVSEFSVRQIRFDPGHRATFWQNNCVAIGMSAGFLEPLESSALVMIELSAAMIAEQMPVTRDAMHIVARRFNDKFRYRWDRIIDFLKLHYVLNRREGPGFWQDNRDPATVPDSLRDLLSLWRVQPPWHDDFVQKDEVFPAASYQYVLYGMGFETKPSHLASSNDSRSFAEQQFRDNAQRTRTLVAALPSHRELLSRIAAHGLQPV